MARTATNPTSGQRSAGWIHFLIFGRNPKRTAIRVVVLVITCFVVFKFILLPVRITGISMLPTYKNHSINFVNRLAYWRHEPRRGDIVGIRFAGTHLMLMKRIVGLPGETIAFENGRILINGKSLSEPYETNACDWNMPPEKIADDNYYVVGDNRTMPQSLHVQGRVARERIVGKALL